MKAILALDPGGTTGWALVQQDEFAELYNVGQIGPGDHHKVLWNMISKLNAQHVDFRLVCESFEFRQGKQRAGIVLVSKEYIGICKLFGQCFPETPVVFQTASQAKAFVTDEKIKALDLWSPGNKHAMDAMRHLITYQVQRMRRHDIIQKWRHL
jgi:hypothetical protein